MSDAMKNELTQTKAAAESCHVVCIKLVTGEELVCKALGYKSHVIDRFTVNDQITFDAVLVIHMQPNGIVCQEYMPFAEHIKFYRNQIVSFGFADPQFKSMMLKQFDAMKAQAAGIVTSQNLLTE